MPPRPLQPVSPARYSTPPPSQCFEGIEDITPHFSQSVSRMAVKIHFPYSLAGSPPPPPLVSETPLFFIQNDLCPVEREMLLNYLLIIIDQIIITMLCKDVSVQSK